LPVSHCGKDAMIAKKRWPVPLPFGTPAPAAYT